MEIIKLDFFKKAKVLFFLTLGIMFVFNTFLSAQNNQGLNKEWKTLIDHNGVSLYFLEAKDNPCGGYLLKIINHSSEEKNISFGVGGTPSNECKLLFDNINSFQSRKILLKPNEILIGTDKLSSLIVPNPYNLPIVELIQNLNIY